MIQAFPSLYNQIYKDEEEDSIDNYEQVISTEQEEFATIMDFLRDLHPMSVDQLKE